MELQVTVSTFWFECLIVSIESMHSPILCCLGKPLLTLVTMAMLIYPLSERLLLPQSIQTVLESQGEERMSPST